MELRQEFEKETKTRKPMTRTHEAYAYYYEKYAEWLEGKVVKLLTTTAVSKSEGLWDGALLLAFRDHLSKKYDKGSAFTLNDIADFLSQQ